MTLLLQGDPGPQAAGDVYWVLVGSRLDLATRDPDLASDHASEVFKEQQKRREANPMTPPELNGQLEEVLQIAGAWFPDLEIPELEDWRGRSK